MRQKLTPGAELDLLTETELRKVLDEVKQGLAIQPARVRGMADGPTDAAGALALEVYRIPAGMGFHLTRLLVRADGFSFAAPFTGAGGMLELTRDDLVIDGKSLVAAAATPDGLAGLPGLFTYGEDAAGWFANESAVGVKVTAGPASTRVAALFEGILRPFVPGN